MPVKTEPASGIWLRCLRGFGNLILRQPRGLRLLICLAWMWLIWSLSSRSEVLPSGADSAPWIFFANLGHAPLFGLLAMWLGLILLPRVPADLSLERALPRLRRTQLALTLVCVLAYGVLDEWHQSWVPGRDATAADVGTDLIGGLCVLWIAVYLARSGAHEPGLRGRLLVGVLFCCLGTGVLTFAI
jgi:hypothetical protein